MTLPTNTTPVVSRSSSTCTVGAAATRRQGDHGAGQSRTSWRGGSRTQYRRRCGHHAAGPDRFLRESVDFELPAEGVRHRHRVSAAGCRGCAAGLRGCGEDRRIRGAAAARLARGAGQRFIDRRAGPRCHAHLPAAVHLAVGRRRRRHGARAPRVRRAQACAVRTR